MLTDFTKAYRAARQASDWRQQQDKIEKACQEAKTMAHFDALLEHFEARDIGSHIADWADEAAYHPHESAGYAMITLEDGAILTQWNDAGFYHTETIGEQEAMKIIEEANAEWSEEEKEEED
jgi:hypothetical protein